MSERKRSYIEVFEVTIRARFCARTVFETMILLLPDIDFGTNNIPPTNKSKKIVMLNAT